VTDASPGQNELRRLVRDLKTSPRFGGQITAVHEIEAVQARHAEWPPDIHAEVLAAARDLGYERPYSHQAAALQCLSGGSSVAVVSGTASGKSLCYVLPALDALVRDPRSRSLMLFPTKALAHDQLAALSDWDAALASVDVTARAYDGDTPSRSRSRIRREGRIIATNPDMLHAAILPHHSRWSALLGNLSLVVVDEMHVYRGVFGSHVANVLRRLRRVARFYGSDPLFVLTSATIANPGELAHRLTGDRVAVVDDDGSPRGRRTFVFYNPPVVDERLNIRRSSLLEAEALARHFVSGDVQTIVFARSRQAAELVVRYIDDGLAERGHAIAGTDSDEHGVTTAREAPAPPGKPHSARASGASAPVVRGYRGGYTPSERREIERGLRHGDVRGVVATTALELGIDIGDLDVCVMAGYPGTVASTWQQSGRAGRRSADSVAVLVASASPLDQFIIRHPEYVLDKSPEHARLDADNLPILLDHVRCAAYELPFKSDEAAMPFGGSAAAGDDAVAPPEPPGGGAPADSTVANVPAADSNPATEGDATRPPADRGDPAAKGAAADRRTPTVAELLAVLTKLGVVRRTDDAWYWLSDEYPAAGVSLRTSGPDAVTIVERRDDGEHDVLGTVERATAPVHVHPGAVYMHDGSTYRVESLDWEKGRAIVSATDPATYTRACSRVDLRPTRVDARRGAGGAELSHGELEVRSRVTGYREIRFRTHEVIGWGDVDLPEQVSLCGGYWFTLGESAVDDLREVGSWRADSRTSRGPDWGVQRDRARERDGYRCRMCGAAEREGQEHDVHHVRPFADFVSGAGDRSAYARANELDNLITLCKSCHRAAERALGLQGALTGVGHALEHVAALHLMCDARDIAVSTAARAPWTGRPTVALFERAVAGVGFGSALFDLHERLVGAAAQLIGDCPCDSGCPSCVGPTAEDGPSAKAHALAVLRVLGA